MSHCATKQIRQAIVPTTCMALLATNNFIHLFENKANKIIHNLHTCEWNNDPTFAFADESHIVDTKFARPRRRVELESHTINAEREFVARELQVALGLCIREHCRLR